jgi:aspartate/methionine/tyrosine aminotransferase
MNQIYTLYESLKGDKNFLNLISTNFSDHFSFPKDLLKKEVGKYIDSRKYSPDSKGNIKARKYISKSFENVFLTASTSESYFLILSSLAKQGDKVSLPKPSYPIFEHLLNGIKIDYEFYDLKLEENWEIDISKLNPKCKFLVLISPSNPTGTCISQKKLDEILSWASKNKVIVILDSVFEDFSENILKINTEYLAFKLNEIIKNNGVKFIVDGKVEEGASYRM